MHRSLLTFLLFLAVTVQLQAKALQQKPAAKTKIVHVLQMDSSKVAVRKLNSDALSKYAKDRDFNYNTDVKDGDTLWDRFWRWFWEMLEKLFGGKNSSTGQANPILRYLLIAAVVGAVIYLVIKTFGVENIFSRDSRSVELPYSESLENIHEISFDSEIEKAVTQRNYRLAVRLLYLRSLKQLSDAGLIQWKIEKTNYAYLNELVNTDQRQTFGILTKQFEYVWYGDFPVDGQSFQNIDTLFHDFKKTLS